MQRNDTPTARKYLARAVRRNDKSAEAWFYFGIAQIDGHDTESAVRAFTKAVLVNGEMVPALYNLAKALVALGKHHEALAYYDRVIAIEPHHLDARNNRGALYASVGRRLDSIEDWKVCLQINPRFPFARGNLLHHAMLTCAWDDFDAQIRQIEADIVSGVPAANPFHLLMTPLSGKTRSEATKLFVDAAIPAHPEGLWTRTRKDKNERLRIAYLSSDFHEHPVARVMADVFESHDRTRFETIAFSTGGTANDPMRRRLMRAFDQFEDVHRDNDEQIARKISATRADILVDMNGFTYGARLGAPALRPAPVQVSLIGYPASMRVSYIDYIIADKTVIPSGAESGFTEQVIRLPNSLLCKSRDETDMPERPQRETYGLPRDSFVFCSFNNTFKITPDVFDVWMRLVKAVDGSVFWMFADNGEEHITQLIRDNLRREAERRGISAERLIFADRVPQKPHLARYALADLFLDTCYYNAHTTASEALWMGLPLVTVLGENFSGRVAASVLNAVGLPELVAHSLGEYEDLAFRLARDPALLAGVKHRLAQARLLSTHFQPGLYAKCLEWAYDHMWRRFEQGMQPEGFSVPE